MKNQTTSIHLHTPSSPRIGEPPEVVPPGVDKVLLRLIQTKHATTIAKSLLGFKNILQQIDDTD